MLEEYIKDIVKSEIAKDNLNKQYGKNSQSTYKVFGDHFNHLTFLTSSNNIRDLLYKVCEDKRINHCLYFHFFKDDVAICSISAHKFLHTKIGKLADELEIKSNRFIITKKTGGIDIEKQKLKQENEKLKEEIEKTESETIKLTNLLNEKIYGSQVLKQEIENLKKENKILHKSYYFISNNELPELQSKVTSKERIATELNLMLNKEQRKNKELKKELLDSKNGLNGANHVIKNNKEWINSQDKKIKELEEEIIHLKSDKEDLQYNLRRKSTQKNQLETKNKFLEDKFQRIYKTIEENYYQDGYYELLRIKNIIADILKES